MLPKELVHGNDHKWMKFYDKIASKYFLFFHIIIPVFTLGIEELTRRMWIELLELRKGDIVLDIATGTGKNLPYLAKKIGNEGIIYGIDISLGMLKYATRTSQKKRNIIPIRANASYLPFKNNCF